MQCSNIFLTKDHDIRLGGCFKLLMSQYSSLCSGLCSGLCSYCTPWFLMITISWGNAGDFGLAKTLKADDLASSVSSSGHWKFLTNYQPLTLDFSGQLLLCIPFSVARQFVTMGWRLMNLQTNGERRTVFAYNSFKLKGKIGYIERSLIPAPLFNMLS